MKKNIAGTVFLRSGKTIWVLGSDTRIYRLTTKDEWEEGQVCRVWYTEDGVRFDPYMVVPYEYDNENEESEDEGAGESP